MYRPDEKPGPQVEPGRVVQDSELIRAVQAGDGSALEAIYRRYLPAVWRYVYWRVEGDRTAAEDIVSETFVAAVREVAELDPEAGPIVAWLIGIARHKLADHRRRARRQGGSAGAGELLRAAAGPGSDATAAAEASETWRRVLTVMDRMPHEERLVLEWKYLEQLSVRQIAERLGRTEKAVESLLYRARRSFRVVFGQAQGRDD